MEGKTQERRVAGSGESRTGSLERMFPALYETATQVERFVEEEGMEHAMEVEKIVMMRLRRGKCR